MLTTLEQPTPTPDNHAGGSPVDHRCSLVQLRHALTRLDELLAAAGAEITIKAIGGFALMTYGIRAAARAFTVDIDTVTGDYSAHVMGLVKQVADELGMDPQWLNNHTVLGGAADDAELVQSMYQAQWLPDRNVPEHGDYRAITLQIATVPTLTRAKIIAADTAEFSGRTQDVPDLLELLRFQGIDTLAEFQARYPDPYDEYPAAHDIVAEHLGR